MQKKYPNPEEELPVRNNTVLNIEVTNVNYNSMNQSKVSVETSAGHSYIADHVIVTPSLGVLKEQYKTLFTPELPEYKVKAIKVNNDVTPKWSNYFRLMNIHRIKTMYYIDPVFAGIGIWKRC